MMGWGMCLMSMCRVPANCIRCTMSIEDLMHEVAKVSKLGRYRTLVTKVLYTLNTPYLLVPVKP